MPHDPGLGSMDDIYGAMAAQEQPVLEVIDADFQAFDYMPGTESKDYPYPFSFSMPPDVYPNDRQMGEGSFKQLHIYVQRILLVGLASDPLGDLTREANRFLFDFVGVYFGNRSLKDSGGIATVHKLEFDPSPDQRVSMGYLPIDNVVHYGIKIPLRLEQRRRYTFVI